MPEKSTFAFGVFAKTQKKECTIPLSAYFGEIVFGISSIPVLSHHFLLRVEVVTIMTTTCSRFTTNDEDDVSFDDVWALLSSHLIQFNMFI